MNYDEKIASHLNQLDLDIRKSKFSRFMDQKVTPDVLSFISDCIINLDSVESGFTFKDIWNSNYFEKNVIAIYGKPAPSNEMAHSEYDKFIVQPLRMLYFAGILSCKKIGNKSVYKIKEYELLEFISIKERNAYYFLYRYILKVLTDSNLISDFNKFKEKSLRGQITNGDLRELKDKFIVFIKENTPINTSVEISRIFPKILNIFAVESNIQGIERGHLSRHKFIFPDLMYNRLNWRDIEKAKSLTRREAESAGVITAQSNRLSNYLIEKAKQIIRRKYSVSEVQDKYANTPAIYVHHIFPVAEYLKIADYLENLIKLTADQHFYCAHPKGNTQLINKDYQCICLIAKSESIEHSLNNGEFIYTKQNFIEVIKIGLQKEVDPALNFNEIRIIINQIYNEL